MSNIDDAISVEIDDGSLGPAAYYNAASRLLEVAAEALDTLTAVGLDGCPDRAYVSPGLPAFDCEQLTVYASALSEEITSPLNPNTATGQRHKFGRISLVSFTTSIARCLPLTDGNVPPDPILEDVASRQLLADARVIWEEYYWRSKRGTLLGDDLCSIRRMNASHVVDPSGGMGGWNIQVTLEIDGYNPQAGS